MNARLVLTFGRRWYHVQSSLRETLGSHLKKCHHLLILMLHVWWNKIASKICASHWAKSIYLYYCENLMFALLRTPKEKTCLPNVTLQTEGRFPSCQMWIFSCYCLCAFCSRIWVVYVEARSFVCQGRADEFFTHFYWILACKIKKVQWRASKSAEFDLLFLWSLHTSQVAHQAEAYPGFCRIKWLGYLYAPVDGMQSPLQGRLIFSCFPACCCLSST